MLEDKVSVGVASSPGSQSNKPRGCRISDNADGGKAWQLHGKHVEKHYKKTWRRLKDQLIQLHQQKTFRSCTSGTGVESLYLYWLPWTLHGTATFRETAGLFINFRTLGFVECVFVTLFGQKPLKCFRI